MTLKSEEKSLSEDIKEIYVYDTSSPTKKDLAYRINKNNRIIEFFPKRERPPFFLPKIQIEGFTNLPNDFSQLGYLKSGSAYYLNKILSGKKVSKILIKKKSRNMFRKCKDSYHITLSYKHFSELNNRLSHIRNESKLDRSQSADQFFHDVYPKHFKKPKLTFKKQIARVVNNLDKNIIPYLDITDIDVILNFFENILKSKYKSEV